MLSPASADIQVTFDETITSVDASPQRPERRGSAPGWIDIQVNGFAGVDYNSRRPPHEEIARSAAGAVRRRRYALLPDRNYRTRPTIWSRALRNLSRAKDTLAEGDAMDGFHVEGPHISPDDGSARRPSPALGAAARSGRVPPLAGRDRRPHPPRDAGAGVARSRKVYREIVRRSGGERSVTPTADGAQIADAVSAGATTVHAPRQRRAQRAAAPSELHLGSARGRPPAWPDFIVDGIHLAASFLKVALRAKGAGARRAGHGRSSPAGRRARALSSGRAGRGPDAGSSRGAGWDTDGNRISRITATSTSWRQARRP